MKKITDLDEVKSIDVLKKELVSSQREAKAAMLTIEKLLKDLSKKAEEIEHLKSMMKDMVPVIQKEVAPRPAIKMNIQPEEEIAEMQLERLRQTAKQRPLTFEETRIYDILVKNKRLSQDQSTINLSKADYKDLSNGDLLEIAGKVAPDESDDKS